MKKTSNIFRVFTALLFGWTAFAVSSQTPAFGGAWETKTSMPTARYGQAIGTMNDKLYVVSGCCSSHYYPWPRYPAVEAYDPVTDSWTENHAPIPTAVYEAVFGVIDNKLYVAGGQADANAGVNQAMLQVYDPNTDAWEEKAPMPTQSAHMSGGVINGKLYVAGGMNPSNTAYVADVNVYDPASGVSGEWKTLTPMPAARANGAAGAINGILYVVGGHDASGGVTAAGEAYDPEWDTWTSIPAMPTARASAEAAVINGILYVVGGRDSSGYLATVEAYDPSTNSWTTEVSMQNARALPAVGVVNNTLYAIGGNIGDLGLQTNEAFTPLINVTIDIKPGSEPNSINLSSAGVVPVAILSSDAFDATTVDPDTIGLAGAKVKMVGKSGKYLCHEEDVNGNGISDLVCQVYTAQFIIEPGESVAVLEAETFGGTPVRGEDTVRIVPDN